jgi:phosphoribosylaminoimidazole carboxylase PurE protein
VPYAVHVLSAHRTPADMLDWAEAAAGAGTRVVIAGAGGAAHLPGMVASMTPLPVIGVPVPLRTWTAWTRCCPSCRCRPGCRSRRSPSVEPATPGC